MELCQGVNHVILHASALCSAPLSVRPLPSAASCALARRGLMRLMSGAIAGRRVRRLTVMHYQSDCPYGHAAGASLFALN
jgi:hypothetical protein